MRMVVRGPREYVGAHCAACRDRVIAGTCKRLTQEATVSLSSTAIPGIPVNFDNTSREGCLGLSWSTALTTRAVREILHLASFATRPQKMATCPFYVAMSFRPVGSLQIWNTYSIRSILGSWPILSLVLGFDASQNQAYPGTLW